MALPSDFGTGIVPQETSSPHHPKSSGSSPGGPTILHKFQGLMALRPRDFSCVAMGSDSLGVTHSRGMDLKERWPFFLILLYYNSRHQAG
jgi:hypothetical protein